MKKFLLFAAAGIIFMSCSKKGTPTPPPTEKTASIIGKWYVAADTVSEFRNGVLVQIDTNAYNHNDYIQFNGGNTGSFFQPQLVSIVGFTYTKSGNVITISIPQNASDGTTEPPLIETYTIKKITDTDLLMSTSETFNYGSVVYTEIGTESFVK